MKACIDLALRYMNKREYLEPETLTLRLHNILWEIPF